MCALRADLAVLPGGDHVQIGDRGINLSGGQKARVALARAVYADADVYLLDDPFSAVDVAVGKHIFEQALRGVLRNKAVVLVTNNLHFLPSCDRVCVLKRGCLVATGSFAELQAGNAAFAQLFNTHSAELRQEGKAEARAAAAEPKAAALRRKRLAPKPGENPPPPRRARPRPRRTAPRPRASVSRCAQRKPSAISFASLCSLFRSLFLCVLPFVLSSFLPFVFDSFSISPSEFVLSVVLAVVLSFSAPLSTRSTRGGGYRHQLHPLISLLAPTVHAGAGRGNQQRRGDVGGVHGVFPQHGPLRYRSGCGCDQ